MLNASYCKEAGKIVAVLYMTLLALYEEGGS